MAIHETYAKRQKRLRGEFNDVYQYEDIPSKLRVQINYLYESFFDYNAGKMNDICNEIHYIVLTEEGLDRLNYDRRDIGVGTNINELSTILLSYSKRVADTEIFLTILNYMIRFIAEEKQEFDNFKDLDLDEVIDEINTRFKESAVGYQIDSESLDVIRIDSELIHSEVMKPVLGILNSEPMYAGSQNEFMTAHDHYRHGRYRDAISSCGNSFESMLKAIHEKRGWDYAKGKATASKLIMSCVNNGLFPSYQEEQLIQLHKILECGVPTIRNKSASHGHGVEVIEIPEHLASYMIHLTATNLLFLANAEKALG